MRIQESIEKYRSSICNRNGVKLLREEFNKSV